MTTTTKRIAALLCVGVLLASMLAVPASASSQVTDNLYDGHTYTILSALDNRWALDVYANDFTPGTNANIWYSNWGDAQAFTINNVYGEWYTITHTASGNVLDVEGGDSSSGANVLLWPYHSENNDNQLWRFERSINGEGGYRIQSKLGTYLTIDGEVANLQNVCASTKIIKTDENLKQPDAQVWFLDDLTSEESNVDHISCDMDIRLWNGKLDMPMYYEHAGTPLNLKACTPWKGMLQFRGTKLRELSFKAYEIDFRGKKVDNPDISLDFVDDLVTRRGSLDSYGVFTLSIVLNTTKWAKDRLFYVELQMRQESGTAPISHFYVKVT